MYIIWLHVAFKCIDAQSCAVAIHSAVYCMCVRVFWWSVENTVHL